MIILVSVRRGEAGRGGARLGGAGRGGARRGEAQCVECSADDQLRQTTTNTQMTNKETGCLKRLNQRTFRPIETMDSRRKMDPWYRHHFAPLFPWLLYGRDLSSSATVP